MGQIHGGASPGSWDNTAIVDNAGYLYTAVSGNTGQAGSSQVYPTSNFASDNLNTNFFRMGLGVYDGTAWDRGRGSAESGLMVYADKRVPVSGIVGVAEGLHISKGEVANTNFIHKFGNTPDYDTSDGFVTVWDGADDGGVDQMQYVYSTTGDIDSLSSDDGTDTQDIEVQGLDSDYKSLTQTVTLNGNTRVDTGSAYMRVFRMKNVNNVDNAGHIYCYVSGATSTGTPNASADVRAVMQPLNNQTLMSIYTIPSGVTGYMRGWFAATAGANRDGNYIIDLRARASGGVFQLKHRSALEDGGTSHVQHQFTEPEKFSPYTDIEMRCSIATGGLSAASLSAGFDLVLVDDL